MFEPLNRISTNGEILHWQGVIATVYAAFHVNKWKIRLEAVGLLNTICSKSALNPSQLLHTPQPMGFYHTPIHKYWNRPHLAAIARPIKIIFHLKNIPKFEDPNSYNKKMLQCLWLKKYCCLKKANIPFFAYWNDSQHLFYNLPTYNNLVKWEWQR